MNEHHPKPTIADLLDRLNANDATIAVALGFTSPDVSRRIREGQLVFPVSRCEVLAQLLRMSHAEVVRVVVAEQFPDLWDQLMRSGVLRS